MEHEIAGQLNTSTSPSTTHTTPFPLPRSNTGELREFLKRDLSFSHAFSLGFVQFATPALVAWYYGVGYYYGGPFVLVWGWVLVTALTLTVVLSLAELVSSLPGCGGLYWQSLYLGGDTWGPLAGWWTGWLSWLSQASCISFTNYVFARCISVGVLMASGSYSLSPQIVFALVCLALSLETYTSVWSVKFVGRFLTIGAVWIIAVSVCLIAALPSISPTLQPASYTLFAFNDNSASTGLRSLPRLCIVGLVMSVNCVLGFEVNGFMAEETKSPQWAAPRATVWAFISAAVLGLLLTIAFTVSIQDPSKVLNPDNFTQGSFASAQILLDACLGRFHSRVGAVAAVALVSSCCLLSSVSRLTGASRLLWAMSSDGATPLSGVWARLSQKGKVPVNAVLLTALLSMCLSVSLCWNAAVFQAIHSFATVASLVSYALPLVMKLTQRFPLMPPALLSLGRFSAALNVVAVLWLVVCCILVCLPASYPVTLDSLNFTPLAFAGTFVVITVPWLLRGSMDSKLLA